MNEAGYKPEPATARAGTDQDGGTLMAAQTAIDEAKVHELLGRVVGDLGGILTTSMVFIGDRLGLYKAIAEAGSVTSGELAARSGAAERYVRDWLVNQAASGYVQYD